VPDIQDYFKSALLLCSSKYTDQSNCALEVVINIKDENVEQISENFFLYRKPLPISRIKTVFFKTEEQKALSLFSVQGGAAFLPESIVQVLNENDISVSKLPQIESAELTDDYTSLIQKFDQLLGGFSMMNIARESNENYSTHFVTSLGNVNSHFNDLMTQQGVKIENPYQFLFEENGNFKNTRKIIFSETNLEIIQEFARKDGVKLETKNGVIQSEKIPQDKTTYILSFLENFGNGKRKQLDSFISELMNGNISEKRKEAISFIFGLNKGYRAFRNKYKTSNFEIDVKFHLDSLFDYYIIESIFQFVFNKKTKSVKFEYIDSFQDKITSKKTESLKPNTYQILDKYITCKKKVAYSEDYSPSFLEARSILFEKITETLSSILPSFLNIDKEMFFNYLHEHFDQAFNTSSTILSKDLQDEVIHNEKYIFELKSNQVSKDKEIESLEAEIINLKKAKTELAEELENIKSISYSNDAISANSPPDYSKNEDSTSKAVNENSLEINNYSQESTLGQENPKKTGKEKIPPKTEGSKHKTNSSEEKSTENENTDAHIQNNSIEKTTTTIGFIEKEKSEKIDGPSELNSSLDGENSGVINIPTESNIEEINSSENSSDNHDKNARAEELYLLSLKDLKDILKSKQIRPISSKKEDLIKQIILMEFK